MFRDIEGDKAKVEDIENNLFKILNRNLNKKLYVLSKIAFLIS